MSGRCPTRKFVGGRALLSVEAVVAQTKHRQWPATPDSAEMQWYEAHALEIRPSNIKGAGLGVFARVDIPSNRLLGRYHGLLLTEAQFDDLYGNKPGGYVLQIGRDKYVDATDPRYRNWTAMINDARNSGQRPNVVFTAAAGIKTSRCIRAGEEILVSYGRHYWG